MFILVGENVKRLVPYPGMFPRHPPSIVGQLCMLILAEGGTEDSPLLVCGESLYREVCSFGAYSGGIAGYLVFCCLELRNYRSYVGIGAQDSA